MGAAVKLRTDYDGARLRDLAKRSGNSAQARRLIALAEIYDGRRRSDAARLAGVGLQIIRDWVLRFNAEGPDGLINRKGSGPPSRLTDEQRVKLRKAVGDGPKPGLFNADYSYRYLSSLLKSIALHPSASAMFVSSLARKMFSAKLRALAKMPGFP